jgi:hypothetical protein
MEYSRTRLDIKYVFDENIERVWKYISNPLLVYQFCPELRIKSQHSISNYIWEEGNTFIITLPKTTESNECTLKYTVLDSLSEPYHKFLKFQIHLENKLNCVVKKTIYHVSTDDATVVIYEMCNSEIYNESQVKILQNLFMKVLTKMDNDLKREVSDFFQYEGLCMNLSCDKLIRDVINGEKMENIEKVSKQYFKSVFALNPESPSRENMPLINSEPKDCNTIKKFGEYLLNKTSDRRGFPTIVYSTKMLASMYNYSKDGAIATPYSNIPDGGGFALLFRVKDDKTLYISAAPVENITTFTISQIRGIKFNAGSNIIPAKAFLQKKLEKVSKNTAFDMDIVKNHGFELSNNRILLKANRGYIIRLGIENIKPATESLSVATQIGFAATCVEDESNKYATLYSPNANTMWAASGERNIFLCPNEDTEVTFVTDNYTANVSYAWVKCIIEEF